MPRIRSIKPEFWSSPDTAAASAVTRLTYIAMWNWADDHGRGTANLKELEGFIFPNDDVEELSHGDVRNFRDIMTEVQDVYAVVFYRVRGRDYYAIPSWDDHQKNERKAKSKYPGPDEGEVVDISGMARANTISDGNARNFRDTDTEAPESSGTGTGEQGNRGTGEQSSPPKSEKAEETRPDVEALCNLLADRIVENGAPRRPEISKAWRDAARLLMDKEGYTHEQVAYLINWSQNDPFWRSNVLSMPKLREKANQLRLNAMNQNKQPVSKTQREIDEWLSKPRSTPTLLEVTQ